MQWSKLRQRCEERIAPEVSGRIRLHLTVLRATHDQQQRGVIYVDNVVWLNACTFHHEERCWSLQQTGKSQAEARRIAHSEGLVAGWEFGRSLSEYLNLDVEESLQSDNPVHRIMGVLDRRLGERRFNAVHQALEDDPLAGKFLEFRMQVRGVNLPVPNHNRA